LVNGVLALLKSATNGTENVVNAISHALNAKSATSKKIKLALNVQKLIKPRRKRPRRPPS